MARNNSKRNTNQCPLKSAAAYKTRKEGQALILKELKWSIFAIVLIFGIILFSLASVDLKLSMRNYIKMTLLHFIVVVVSIVLFGMYWNVGITVKVSFIVTCISMMMYILFGIIFFSSVLKDNIRPLVFFLLTSMLISMFKTKIIPLYYLFNLPFIYTLDWGIHLPFIIEEVLILLLPTFCIFTGVFLKFITKNKLYVDH